MSLNKLSVSYLSWFVLSLTRFPTNVFIFYAMQVTYPLIAFCVLCLWTLDASVSPFGAPFLLSLSLSLCSMCLDSGCKSITFCGSFSFIRSCQFFSVGNILSFKPAAQLVLNWTQSFWGDIVIDFSLIPSTFNQMFLSPFIILAPVVPFAKTLWHFPPQADTFYAWLFSILILQTSALSSLIVRRLLRTTLDFSIYFFDYFQFLSNPTKFCPLVWTSEILDCWSCQGKKPAPTELY